jgi:type VI secretion system secreted protein Hcp
MGLYMRYDNGSIQGDATQKGFEGWMNLHSFQWDMARAFTKDTGRAYNREGAQAHVGRITVIKEVDHASGQILKTACTEHKGKTVEIAFVRTGDPGDPYLKFTLTDTVFQNLQVMGARQGDVVRPTEKITLDFTELLVETVVLKEDNTGEAPCKITYNIATGLGG